MTGQVIVVVSSGCHNKIPQTRRLKQREFISHSSGCLWSCPSYEVTCAAGKPGIQGSEVGGQEPGSVALGDGCEVFYSLLEQPHVLLMNPAPRICLLSFLCLTAFLPHLLLSHLPIPVSESSLGDPSRTLII